MNSFSIRSATPADARGIAAVHVATWQCAYRGQIPDKYLDSLNIEARAEKWKEILEKSEQGMQTIVAETDNKIVAWCSYGKSRDTDASSEVGELGGIYVDPNHMHKGIGTALLKSCNDALAKKGYKILTLWVLNSNSKARKFYEKQGWITDGTTKVDEREGFTLHEIRYLLHLDESRD